MHNAQCTNNNRNIFFKFIITNLFRRGSVLLFELVALLLFLVFVFRLLVELEEFAQHFLLTCLALEVEIVAVALVVLLADFAAVVVDLVSALPAFALVVDFVAAVAADLVSVPDPVFADCLAVDFVAAVTVESFSSEHIQDCIWHPRF